MNKELLTQHKVKAIEDVLFRIAAIADNAGIPLAFPMSKVINLQFHYSRMSESVPSGFILSKSETLELIKGNSVDLSEKKQECAEGVTIKFINNKRR